MRKTRIIATLLGGVLLILSACASPAATTPAAAAATPAATTPAATTTPAPAAATTPAATTTPAPAPAAVPAPGQAGFLAGAMPYKVPRYIVQVTPAPGQAGFLVSQLRIAPEEVVVGDNVTVSVVVTNTGGQRGTYTIVLKFDDAIIKTQDVTIDGGGSRKVELNVVAWTYGEFKVMADQLTANLRALF